MFCEPDDPAIRDRLRRAFAEAQTRLAWRASADATPAWGHNGRTLGAPVETVSGRAWLRVMEVPAREAGGKLWTGTADAAKALPAQVPRPQLLETAEWVDDEYAYRAELTTYVAAAVCSSTPDLVEDIHLPDEWWTRLREASDAIAATPVPETRAPVISQDYVHRAIPRYLGVQIDTTVHQWSLAHGDLHWANLTSPELNILDWEGFGPAPCGFDAAHLYAYALPSPREADRVRSTFAGVLNTPQGRLAELTVAAILLQAAERDPIHARLAPHVQAHANALLTGRPG